MVDNPHGKGVTFTIRSAPVGYAAEYLTRAIFPLFSLIAFLCIIPFPTLTHSSIYTFYTLYTAAVALAKVSYLCEFGDNQYLLTRLAGELCRKASAHEATQNDF